LNRVFEWHRSSKKGSKRENTKIADNFIPEKENVNEKFNKEVIKKNSVFWDVTACDSCKS
jgi:hypothetical protein